MFYFFCINLVSAIDDSLMKIDLGIGILFDLWGLNDSLISEYNGRYLHLI